MRAHHHVFVILRSNRQARIQRIRQRAGCTSTATSTTSSGPQKRGGNLLSVKTQEPMWLRVAQFPPLRLAMFGAVMFYMLGYSNKFIGDTAGNPLLQIAVVIGWSAVAFAVYIGLVRLIERRPVTELALPGMGRELGIGLLIGAGLYTACILILMVMGIYKIDGLNPVSYLLSGRRIAVEFGRIRGTVVPRRAVPHRRGVAGQLDVAGRVIAGVRPCPSDEPGRNTDGRHLHQRRSWRPARRRLHADPAAVDEHGLPHRLELHPVRNLSGTVSGGYSAEPGLIKPVIDGPVLPTGGTFGVESSGVAFVLCTATGVVLLVMAVRRGHVVAPFWKRNG